MSLWRQALFAEEEGVRKGSKCRKRNPLRFA
jgi:hypothetical protein